MAEINSWFLCVQREENAGFKCKIFEVNQKNKSQISDLNFPQNIYYCSLYSFLCNAVSKNKSSKMTFDVTNVGQKSFCEAICDLWPNLKFEIIGKLF